MIDSPTHGLFVWKEGSSEGVFGLFVCLLACLEVEVAVGWGVAFAFGKKLWLALVGTISKFLRLDVAFESGCLNASGVGFGWKLRLRCCTQRRND